MSDQQMERYTRIRRLVAGAADTPPSMRLRLERALAGACPHCPAPADPPAWVGRALNDILTELESPSGSQCVSGGNAIRRHYDEAMGREPVDDGAIETDVAEADVAYRAMIQHIKEGGR